MWLWHIPALYDAATEHPGVHVLEHLCFGLAGGLYWWHLLSPIRTRHRLSADGAGRLHARVEARRRPARRSGSPSRPTRSTPTTSTRPQTWGLTAADDQALAGVVMAVEQSIVMGIALAWLFTRMLGESEREQLRAERAEAIEA